MDSTFLLYGANGYTGALIAREAVRRGLRPVLAGRNAQTISALANELGLEYRVFPLEDRAATLAALSMAPLVLHCAGPFVYTAEPMMEAALHANTHYLDITGEIPIFEMMAAKDADARARGVMLLPGAGFDVVPSDCLAAHLKRRLASANRLTLAFKGLGGVSRGTATTMIEMMSRGTMGMVRRNGRLTDVPFAWKIREVDFGRGPRPCVSIPWGDVSTAYYSTNIPNIEVYMAISALSNWFLGTPIFARWLLQRPRVQEFLRKRIRSSPDGPDDQARAKGLSLLWGRAEDSAGASAECRMQTPEGYTLTVLSSLAIVERVLAGDVTPGFQTPAKAYGADFILGIEGVVREDL